LDGEREAWFSQQGYRCRLEWGRGGSRRGADRGDVLVVVDTLRFSTAVATAVHHGAIVYPCRPDEDAAALAARVGARVAADRPGSPEGSRSGFSLSPLSYVGVAPGTRVVLPSPNGATCLRDGAAAPHLFAGALVNAGAVAAAVARVLEATDLRVTLVACGERWVSLPEDGPLRVAIEDGLGAGAILAALAARGHSQSPEARVWIAAFQAASSDLADVLWECGSGRELRAKGFGADVRHAARLDLYDAVPALRNGRLTRHDA
jgi:2-phosphosulfolactate phosphatase